MKSPFLSAVLCLPLLIVTMPLTAQEMHEAATKPSDHLEIIGLDGTKIELSPADVKSLPHKTITVFNAHLKKSESYSGVELSDLLAKVHAPAGEALRGKLFMTGVVPEGTDGYTVLYSIAEVDPAMHSGDVIVADSVNGEPLSKNGAFQLINTEDKRPARWVRNLNKVTVESVSK